VYSTGKTTVYLFTDAKPHSCHAHIGLFTFVSIAEGHRGRLAES